MKTERSSPKVLHKIRPGTIQHDEATARLMLVLMVDLCSPADKRLRFQLAGQLERGELCHGDVVLAV